MHDSNEIRPSPVTFRGGRPRSLSMGGVRLLSVGGVHSPCGTEDSVQCTPPCSAVQCSAVQQCKKMDQSPGAAS